MCGFLFVARRNAPVNNQPFKQAFSTIRHRGPDYSAVSSGAFTVAAKQGDAVIHWMAGHHRLSILDLDPRSNQPFERDGDILLFNGEIYNFREIRQNGQFPRFNFTTDGDTELLFQGLKTNGLDALSEMNGMWAFTFLQPSKAQLIASRDRYGKKPLFWYSGDDLVCFASTMTAIDRYLERKPRCNAEAAKTFLTHGKLFPSGDESTHHSDIKQVAPSGAMMFDFSTWTANASRYFKFEDLDIPAAGMLPAQLSNSLGLRLVSDRPVGLLLSGGIDSSLILSIAAATGRFADMRYLIGDTGQSEDAQYAKDAIKQLGLSADVVEIQYAGQALEHFLSVCRHQEKPFPLLGNSMAMGAMYEAVAEHGITVAIDGTGGDEVFGGYWDRYFPFAMRQAARERNTRWIAQMVKARFGNLGYLLPKVNLPTPLARIEGEANLNSISRFDSSKVIDRDPLTNSSLSLAEALQMDATSGRLGEWLWQNDRNAMMFSIENRSPLLDYQLGSYFKTGYEQKFHAKWNKFELRKSFDAFKALPTQWRIQKQGFRWDRRRFLRQNKPELLEIIRSSTMVDELVDRSNFIENARKRDKYFCSPISQRIVVLAGLEAALGMTL